MSTIFSASGLTLTRVTLLGSMLGAIAYGTAANLYFMCLYLRLRPTSKAQQSLGRTQNIALTVHTTAMFILITVIIGSHVTKLWNFFPATTGAPFDDRFITEEGIGHLGTFASFMNNWLSDALLIWRCYVLLQTDNRTLRLGVVITLSCMLLPAIALSIVQLASIYTYAVVTTSIAFFLTITLNVFATGIIVVRLLLHRRRLVRVMGGKSDVGDCYTNIAAILMESAALVVVFDIFFAVTFIKGGPLFNLCSEMIGHIQAIGSFLIIFRILQGKVWSSTSSEKSASEKEVLSSSKTTSSKYSV